ncbi:N-acetylmuramoyl-L-alanine amidase [Georgenia subflava]|uniref:Peptidoglycan recognition protein family domain-containing protein n=1 Tax=Georgenia subflava TaxID=1622177 RepID=A0A6N7EG64_9MICO|nr:N-acetylmuramoyl-L-alanine amidase [Georgenia subflava]MPV36391.1 hypothetical protein [Georgenia subflava]
MRALRATISLTVLTVLAAATAAPAAAATAGDPLPAPAEVIVDPLPAPAEVTVFALTGADGTRTDVAVDGLDDYADAPARTVVEPTGVGGAGGTPTMRMFSTSTITVDDVAVLTPPMATDDFTVAALTWDVDDALAADAQMYLRVQDAGAWTDWAPLEVDDARGDGVETTAGSEPFITGAGSAVQVQITGAVTDLPTNLRLELIPSNAATATEVTTTAAPPPAVAPAEEIAAPAVDAATLGNPVAFSPATTATAPVAVPTVVGPAGRPSIISRSAWRADETKMRWKPWEAPLKAAVVHHTAGSNSYTKAQSAGIVRGIYYFHAVTRGWGDIGYNFLVDKYGQVFEGRKGSLTASASQMVVGAHAAPANTGTVGVSLLGDYTKVDAPQVGLDAMTDVIAWRFSLAGIDATTRSGMTSTGGTYARSGYALPRIFGHGAVSSTACPGLDILDYLPTMTTKVAGKVAAGGPTTPPAVRPSPPAPTSPALPLATFYLNNAYTTQADVVFQYGHTKTSPFVGDWDGDGVDTIAARDAQVFFVRNANRVGNADTVFAYGKPGDVVLVGDWDGDGVDTLAVRRGREYHIKNSVTSGKADQVIFYGRPGDEVLVGDWDGDGRDTLTVRRGQFYYVKNSISTGVADTVVAYGRPADAVLSGDWDGDGTDTFAVRRGAQYLVKNSMASGVADKTLVYGRPTDSPLVGDWDGDGEDTFGVRRIG